ncbi:protein FAM81A-like [Dysidea avara]|uniref:protein FAM81A-like n=1 Tax=Dysidea avara TaxID=196820 RepID=UPI003325B405
MDEDVAIPEGAGSGSKRDDVFSIERRLVQQEAITNILWRREKQLGRELVASSSRSEDSHVRNKRSYDALCKHVDTLAGALRGLNQDMQHLQGQVRLGDHQLDLHDKAVRGLGQWCTHDVRGQISRCDHALMSLMIEVKNCQQEVRTLQREHESKEKFLQEKIQNLEAKNAELEATLKQDMSNRDSHHKHFQAYLKQELATMETKLKGQINELTSKCLNNNQLIENNISRQQSLLSTKVDISQAQRDAKHREMEGMLHAQLKKLEQAMETEKRRYSQLEDYVKNEMKLYGYQQQQQLERIHHDQQEALVSVQENIKVMKSLIDYKISILESKLRKQLLHPHTILLK